MAGLAGDKPNPLAGLGGGKPNPLAGLGALGGGKGGGLGALGGGLGNLLRDGLMKKMAEANKNKVRGLEKEPIEK